MPPCTPPSRPDGTASALGLRCAAKRQALSSQGYELDIERVSHHFLANLLYLLPQFLAPLFELLPNFRPKVPPHLLYLLFSLLLSLLFHMLTLVADSFAHFRRGLASLLVRQFHLGLEFGNLISQFA